MVETAETSVDYTPDRAAPERKRKPAETRQYDGRTPLDNPRWEMFCHYMAQGSSAYEAYQKAGYTPNEGNCIRLKGNDRIKARIAAVVAQIAEKQTTIAAYDKAYVLRQAVKLHELSMAHTVDENGGFVGSAANAASRTLGQIGEHVDVQAWKAAQDINVHITVDQAIARLESQAIEADYTDITED
jgi:hypothetical protein